LQVEEEVEKFMMNTKDDYNNGTGIKAAWDWIQDEVFTTYGQFHILAIPNQITVTLN